MTRPAVLASNTCSLFPLSVTSLEPGHPMPSHADRKPAQHSAQSQESGQAKSYTSPPRKLMGFFEKSRDQWKAKCLEAKTNVKYLSNRIRFLAKSKDRWKHRVRALEADLAKLEAQVRARDNEIEALKKLSADPSDGRQAIAAFRQPVPYHTYSVGPIWWWVALVLSSATSLHGASVAMALSLSVLQLPCKTPAWSSGRLWLIRLGYYKLSRPRHRLTIGCGLWIIQSKLVKRNAS